MIHYKDTFSFKNDGYSKFLQINQNELYCDEHKWLIANFKNYYTDFNKHFIIDFLRIGGCKIHFSTPICCYKIAHENQTYFVCINTNNYIDYRLFYYLINITNY